jgi:hypothetical protein
MFELASDMVSFIIITLFVIMFTFGIGTIIKSACKNRKHNDFQADFGMLEDY